MKKGAFKITNASGEVVLSGEATLHSVMKSEGGTIQELFADREREQRKRNSSDSPDEISLAE